MQFSKIVISGGFFSYWTINNSFGHPFMAIFNRLCLCEMNGRMFFNHSIHGNSNFLIKSSKVHKYHYKTGILNLKKILLISLLFFVLKTASQNCLYLAYDGFQYDQNIPLNGLSGGTGWFAPWDVQVGNTDIPGYQTQAQSLVYSDVQTAGGKAIGGKDYLTAGRLLDAGNDGAFAAYVSPGQTGIGTLRGDTLWYSLLLSKMQSNDHAVNAVLHNGNVPWHSNFSGSYRVGVGYFGDQSDVNGERRWTLLVENNYYHTTAVASGTAFFVVRIIFDENTTKVDLFLNPSMTGFEGPPETATLSMQTNSLLNFRSYAVYLGHAPGNGQIDELRFAGSWTCVTPDAAVPVNLPPIAAFDMTPATGSTPVSVEFNSADSFDPENGTLSFLWNFGDGSAGSTAANPVHLYENLTGEIPVSLTVTDPEGLSQTMYHTLVLLNEYDTYSCQTTVSCINMASCGQNDARIRVNAGNHTIQMRDSQNNTLSPVNGNEFHNLSPGNYQLFIAGNGTACTDTFQIFIRTDSTTCENWTPSDCVMEIGTNMSSFTDWSFERPMKNLFKHIRSDILTYSDSQGCWDCGVLEEMEMDPNGYPLYIPQNTSIGATMVRYVISANGGNLHQDSSYVLLYDGQGTITINGGVTILSSAPGRIAFSPQNTGHIWIHITSSLNGNHIRNIRVLRPYHEFENLAEHPFYEVFLDKITPFTALRFMDWGRTNNSPLISWSERANDDYFTYGTSTGVPYETMIQLANYTSKDVWICVPHMADDQFITQMAMFFRDHLDPTLKIYLEYSNEVWNWIFEQAHYNNNNRPLNLSYGRAMAEKAGNVFRIWRNVFAGQECRVKRVLGLQGGYNGLNEQILSQLSQDEWDYGSPTHYFGLTHGSEGIPELFSGSTVQDVMTNAMNSWNGFRSYIKNDYNNVHLFGKEVITYEGGQHFVGNVFGIPYDYQEAMWEAQYSPEMYNMYREIHQTIRAWGCRLAMNFTLAYEQESIYGSWGALSDIDMQAPYMNIAPKYQALLDEAASPDCRQLFWWEGKRSASWSDPCNWDQGVLPGQRSTVFIPGNSGHQPEADINTVIKSLNVLLQGILSVLTGVSLSLKE